MKYFTLDECIRSDTARDMGIDNTPGDEHRVHIEESITSLVDPMREAWAARCADEGLGTPAIRISSGYRCPALNLAVGGAATSAHCYGYAFDLVPMNGNMSEFKRFCRDFVATRAFDQLISEGEGVNGLPGWMHVGYKSPRGEQRRQLLSMIDGKYLPMTK